MVGTAAFSCTSSVKSQGSWQCLGLGAGGRGPSTNIWGSVQECCLEDLVQNHLFLIFLMNSRNFKKLTSCGESGLG